MDLYQLVETVCSVYGSCSTWVLELGLTLQDCQWALANYYGEGVPSCVYERVSD